jgi:ferredoxin
LKRAVLAASGLIPLTDGTGADRIPAGCTIDTPARVAAWAVGELRLTPGSAGQDGSPAPRAILGQGAPLGVLRAGDGCTACGVCTRICPARALTMTAGAQITTLVLDPAACTGCGVCVQACPEGVLDVVAGVDLDLLDAGCHPIARLASASCPDCGESVLALPASAHLPPLSAGLAGRCPRCRQAVLAASAGAC